MTDYQWATKYGEIIIENYDEKTMKLNDEQVIKEIENAFFSLNRKISLSKISEENNEIYQLTINKSEELDSAYICVKGTTPGGRKALVNEQRIQVIAKNINFMCEKKKSNSVSILMGIYKYDDEIVFCAWNLTESRATDISTPISKQIKIGTIAKAYIDGFVQQKKRNSEYACAFRKEFIYFYLKNCNWLHEETISTIPNHNNNVLQDQKNFFLKNYESVFSRNLIIFGAPGTGKSYILNKHKDTLLQNGGTYERVTFYPDYSYANFVGTYKPVPLIDENGIESITYKYVPGPFMRLYAKALKNTLSSETVPYLLIIEEINRTNVAAVFGDLFQLLDRDNNNVSEYQIQASEDVKKYLADEVGGEIVDYSEIKLPANFFIWATMNSADQGVYPLDTAFKRRWDFEYLGINNNESNIQNIMVVLGMGSNKRTIEWNKLRKAINRELLSYKTNEDKLLGTYFISNLPLEESTKIDSSKFNELFRSKVLMYLFEDAAKQKRHTLFSGCVDSSTYSSICNEFNEKGVFIFNNSISDQFYDATISSEDNMK